MNTLQYKLTNPYKLGEYNDSGCHTHQGNNISLYIQHTELVFKKMKEVFEYTFKYLNSSRFGMRKNWLYDYKYQIKIEKITFKEVKISNSIYKELIKRCKYFHIFLKKEYEREMYEELRLEKYEKIDLNNWIYREFEKWLNHRLKRIERIKVKRLDGRTVNMSKVQLQNYIDWIEERINEINQYAENYENGINNSPPKEWNHSIKWKLIINSSHRELEGKKEIELMKKHIKFLEDQEKTYS